MQTLIDLFKLFPARGHKTAVVYRTGIRRFIFSYREIYSLSLRMANWLEQRGIGKGDRVVLWAPNGPWWMISFWSITLRGAIVVPVDFMSNKERAESIAGLTDSRLIIQSQYKIEKIISEHSVLIEDLEYLIPETEAALPGDIKPEDIAEIIYTSGTTGDPKGVILTHKNLVTNLEQSYDRIPTDDNYRFLSLLPLSHMFEQIGGFLMPLYRGGSIIYIRTLKPSAIMEALAEEDIYALMIVPRLLQLLKSSIEQEFKAKHVSRLFEIFFGIAGRVPRSIRKLLFSPVQHKFGRHFELMISGGAALDPQVAEFWELMGFIIIEGYGLTECSPVLVSNYKEKQVHGSVGTALRGVQLKIVEQEILAKGDNIFPGYWHNPSATSAAFTADGWFKTGDLGVIDAQGQVYIKGRKKDLIVTSAGVNVYPDDIEAILSKLPGIKEACVIGLDRGQGEEVHAVLVLDSDSAPPQELIRQANGLLDPEQQISGFSLWHDRQLPKTPTLKIQRFKVSSALAEQRQQTDTKPADALFSIIARIANTPASNLTEDSVLAELGISSVGRLELVNFIEQEYRLDLEERVITQRTTIADLRKVIESRKKFKVNTHFHFWTNSPLGRTFRILNDLWQYPIFYWLTSIKSSGVKNVKLAKPPVIFICNHISFIDHPAVMLPLPPAIRYRTATAAFEEFYFPEGSIAKKIFRRILFYYCLLVYNIFPIPQEKGFRKTIEFMGKLADHNVNILFFPEGERSRTGKLLPFMQGLGLVVKELKLPIVPIKMSGMETVFPRGASMAHRGKVKIVYGEPINFTTETPAQIIEIAHKAIQNLKI